MNAAEISGWKYGLGLFCLMTAVGFLFNLIFRRQESTGSILAVAFVTALIYVVRRSNFFD